MKHQVQTICLLLAVISFFGGIADVAIQFWNGDDIIWRIPLILIGTGVGMPLIILPFYSLPEKEEYDYDSNADDFSKEFEGGSGFLSSNDTISGEPGDVMNSHYSDD